MIETEIRKEQELPNGETRVWLWYVSKCEVEGCDQPLIRWLTERHAERSERYHEHYLHATPRPKKVPEWLKALRS